MQFYRFKIALRAPLVTKDTQSGVDIWAIW